MCLDDGDDAFLDAQERDPTEDMHEPIGLIYSPMCACGHELFLHFVANLQCMACDCMEARAVI